MKKRYGSYEKKKVEKKSDWVTQVENGAGISQGQECGLQIPT